MIKITYTCTHMLYFYHWKIASIKYAYPKKVCHMPKRHDQKKERKDTYPKKVCHMSIRHVEKNKREEKKYPYIAHVQEKNTGREINHAKEFIHYPPKIFHTLAPFD